MRVFPHLGLGESVVPEFSNALASYLPPEVPRGSSLEAATSKLLVSLDELASPEVAKKRAERFGVSEEQVKEKARCLEEGKPLAAGLRFRKLNPEFPFAHITLGFVPSPEDLSRLREMAPAWFPGISLRGITLRAGPAMTPAVPYEKWSHAVFGSTAAIPALALPRELDARWEVDCAFYPLYAREYAELLRTDPDKNAFLHSEDLETIEEAVKAGLLLSVYDAQGWAGVIAGKAKPFYGLESLYIFEIFLAARLRGKRIAAPFESLFLRGLEERFAFVFGHISEANPSSLRTARSLGRRVVESELFLPL